MESIRLWLTERGVLVALSTVLCQATPSPASAGLSPGLNDDSPEKICQTLPSDQDAVLRWCESKSEFEYEILTWDERLTMSKSETLADVSNTIGHFLNDECNRGSLSFDSASAELWLHIPSYGAELATPRLVLRLEDGIKTRHLLFSQGPFPSGFQAGVENMGLLGTRGYGDFDGFAYFGFAPEKGISLKLKDELGPSIPPKLEENLSRWGVTALERNHRTKPRYLAWTRLYDEEDTLDRILNDPEANEYLEYAEANGYAESGGRHFLLVDVGALPITCPID